MKQALLAVLLGMFSVAAVTAPEAPRTEKRVYGWRPPVHGPVHTFSTDRNPEPREKLPVLHQVTDTGPVLVQGRLGSCGPNAMASVLMHAGMPLPSRLFIYYETRQRMQARYGTDPDADTGVSNLELVSAVSEAGWPDETYWPYDITQFRARASMLAYVQAGLRKGAKFEPVPTTVDAVKRSLWANRPVIIGFVVFESFEHETTGKTGNVQLPAPDEEILGGHDVLIVGWDDTTDRFLFKNSFGPDWGLRGYGTLPYEYLADPMRARDFWALVNLAK